mgnify:CR=1 FL=1
MELLLLHRGREAALAEFASSRGMRILDYSGRMCRMFPSLAMPAIDVGDLDSALSKLVDALAAGQGVCVYSLSAIWALAYAQLGIRGSVPALTSFALRASEASRAFGSPLCFVAEEWFQRRGRYVYNIFRYAAGRVISP